MSSERVPATPTAATDHASPAPAVAPPVPSAPVPLPVGGLVVGHAEDHAEVDADRRADTALARLRAAEAGEVPGAGPATAAADAHLHGPGCDHLRRSPAPDASAATPVVGYEGGTLDTTTTDAITRARGSGRPLDPDVRRRMETAFDTSLSGVRIHADDTAARLNTAVSARAFTTGNDVFFGKGQYAPGTPAGDRVLAHEIAHTLQPETGAHRMFGNLFDEPGTTPAAVPAGPARINLEPRTLDELVACSDRNIELLLADTSPTGRLMGVLRGAFEADWFRAKSCLVFDKWPGERTPAFSHATSLKLMSALTVLRGAVHQAVMPLAKKQVQVELARRARQVKEGNARLSATLSAETGLAPDTQVEYKGSVGADTVTSDVDVSTGGANSEVAVRAYNEAFRAYLKLDYDPGTVFDLNVYAMDFIFGRTDSADKKSFTVNTENPEQPDAADAAERDREQDIWALVHVARFMPDDADWDEHVQRTLSGIKDPGQRAEQQSRLSAARSRAKGFEDRLVAMMAHLEETMAFGEKQLRGSSWDGEENRHYVEGALRMRAANRLYEDKLLQVKELRAEIARMRAAIETGEQGADPRQLTRLVARLSGELSMAQLYANEVYGTGGGTVHAVMGMQVKKKLAAERLHDVEAKIPVEQWYQTFTDNLGDVLKDFEHYGKSHGEGPADHWYAAFKMGKYVDRMVDALPHLSEGGLITPVDGAELAGDDGVAALRELAVQHVTEKNGPSKDDPMRLKDHPYFGRVDGATLRTIRRAALDLGVRVRQMVATKAALAARAAEPTSAAPVTMGPASGSSPAVSYQLAMMEARAREALEELEEEADELAAH